jgi:hypothetical protein
MNKDLRGAQSKLARLRTSVAQQTGLPEEQRPTWRSSRGAAKATAAMEMIAVMVNCMLKVGCSWERRRYWFEVVVWMWNC